MKATRINVQNPETRENGITAAVSAIQQQKNIVIPTDTVYGIAADAFSPDAVAGLLAAKGRSRTMPPPVLIFDKLVMPSLAENVSGEVNQLAEKFWPGALTLILYSQPSLQWDLGETKGTVALRVPDDEITRELLKNTGPLAVSSANKTGRPAATDADEAMTQLGEDVELIVDGGIRPVGRGADVASETVQPSTIIDCTSDRLVVVREGAISIDELREVVPSIVTRAELEAEEKQSRLASVEGSAFDSNVAESSDDDDEESLEAGPHASTAEPGTVNEALMANSTGWMKVDQRRVAEAKRPSAPATSEMTTPPLSVASAYALVHGGLKDDTAEFADESADEQNVVQLNPEESSRATQTPEAELPAAVRAEETDTATTYQPQTAFNSVSGSDQQSKAPWTQSEES